MLANDIFRAAEGGPQGLLMQLFPQKGCDSIQLEPLEVQGNWGNALMEYGQLKADYRDQVASTPTATVEEEQQLLGASENLRCEATDLLRLAGAALTTACHNLNCNTGPGYTAHKRTSAYACKMPVGTNVLLIDDHFIPKMDSADNINYNINTAFDYFYIL